MTTTRERMLAGIRAAVAGRIPAPHPGPFPITVDEKAGVTRFIEQFRANGGETVHFESAAAARAWLDRFAGGFAGVACARVPADLSPDIVRLPPEAAPLGISVAAGAAAETGTLLLDSAAGRRQQLLPPVHLVWVRERDIAGTLGEALARVRAAAGAVLPAAIGLHSAPSKSADIGRVLIVGVHGPGRVIAAIIPGD